LRIYRSNTSSVINLNDTSSFLISNEAAKSFLPQPNPAKKKHVSMVVELPYSAGPSSQRILMADSVIEIAVSIINNSTDILPDTNRACQYSSGLRQSWKRGRKIERICHSSSSYVFDQYYASIDESHCSSSRKSTGSDAFVCENVLLLQHSL
jgi:hypothetical protein